MSKQDKEIQRYMFELKECLMKVSVEELEKFMEKNKNIIGKEVVIKFKNAPYEVKEITLYKMMLARSDMTPELHKLAELWLKNHNCSLTL